MSAGNPRVPWCLLTGLADTEVISIYFILRTNRGMNELCLYVFDRLPCVEDRREAVARENVRLNLAEDMV